MSWFPETEAEPREGDEVAEGVLLERRDVLRVSIGALALLSLGWPQRALALQGGPDDDGELAWDAFLKRAVPMAEKLVGADKPDEDLYLLRLAALVKRLKVPDEKDLRDAKRPLSVVQFKLQAGRGFAWHDHRDYNGLILVLGGEARVRTGEIVGDDPRPPKGKSFEIKETANAQLAPGRITHLSRTRDNLHDVKGGEEGCRLLDLFTFFPGSTGSHYLTVGEKPKDAEKRIYEASWR